MIQRNPEAVGPGPAALDRALDVLGPLGERVVRNGPLGPLTTYRVGGPAAVLVTAVTVEDLDLVAEARAASGLPVLVVGRGSNLLVADAGFPGLAVVLEGKGFSTVAVDGVAVRAGAAVALPALARQTVEAGLSGLEWAVGVPGSVGGAVRMNAGGHGSDTAASLGTARLFDLAADPGARGLEWTVADLQYRYRASAVRVHHVVLEATFHLAEGDRETGRETIREIVRWRREHQPGGQNAGSVFTNPPGDSAGRLVESVGLKGRRLGTAVVSDKHANFIQADPAGSADDVAALMGAVQAEVQRATGVVLQPEVQMVGFSTSSGGLELANGDGLAGDGGKAGSPEAGS